MVGRHALPKAQRLRRQQSQRHLPAVCWVDSSISGRRVWEDYGFTSHLSPIPPASQGSHPRRSTQSYALLNSVPVPGRNTRTRGMPVGHTPGLFGDARSPIDVMGKRYGRTRGGLSRTHMQHAHTRTHNKHSTERLRAYMQRRTHMRSDVPLS